MAAMVSDEADRLPSPMAALKTSKNRLSGLAGGIDGGGVRGSWIGLDLLVRLVAVHFGGAERVAISRAFWEIGARQRRLYIHVV